MFSRKNAIHSHAERFSTLSGSYVRREKAKCKQTAAAAEAGGLLKIFFSPTFGKFYFESNDVHIFL